MQQAVVTLGKNITSRKIQFLSDGWTKTICQDGVVGVTSKLSISFAMRNECLAIALILNKCLKINQVFCLTHASDQVKVFKE